MTELTDLADAVANRAHRASLLIPAIERHLLEDQADAIAGPPRAAGEPAPPRFNDGSDAYATLATDDIDVDLGHSDPVPQAAARIGKYRRLRMNLIDSLAGVERSLNHLEKVCTASISVSSDDTFHDDEPRCPGWTEELRARLGGCGAVLESYTRNDKTTGARSLCAGCRKAEGRAKRAEQAETQGVAS